MKVELLLSDILFFGRVRKAMAIIYLLLLNLDLYFVSSFPELSNMNKNNTHDLKNNGSIQNDTDSGKTPRLIFPSYASDKNGPNFPASIVILEAAIPNKIENTLQKDEAEFLRWLDIDPGPTNFLAHIKKFKRHNKPQPQFSSEVVQTEEKILKLIYNDISLNFDKESKKQPNNVTARRSSKHKQQDDVMREPLRWINVSGSLNPLVSLNRSRRQLDELPPGGIDERPSSTDSPGAKAKTNFVKRKILTMMTQSLYSAQERLWPLGPIVKKYDHLAPYRMAFIFLKLDQLVHESHSILLYLERETNNAAMTVTKRLQLYSQLLRRNIDVTYLVDYIQERVPRDKMIHLRGVFLAREQKNILDNKAKYDKTTTKILGRP